MIVITGPTATGKSELALRVAIKTGAEIISCDSMQIYRSADIGTAKVTLQERAQVKHHLIDIVSPKESFSVADFKKRAIGAIEEIRSRGREVVLAGGTGLYLNAVLFDYPFSQEDEDKSLRQELWSLAEKEGPMAVYHQLAAIDPVAAQSVHPNNVKRVIRMIEKLKAGKPILQEDTAVLKEAVKAVILDAPREVLYRRIDERVEAMFQSGLLEEVKSLSAQGVSFDDACFQAIGYREFKDYFKGEATLETVKEKIKIDTRHYAKRQLTWFRTYDFAKRFDCTLERDAAYAYLTEE